MSSPRPDSLPENAGLAFVGEVLWEMAQLTPRQAKVFQAARNPTGRPNSDVMRRFISVEAGLPRVYAQIDFPAHFHEQETGLYLKPAGHLRSRKNDATGSWWLNPHANSVLRTSVARLDRYLATPRDAEMPAWDWIDSESLPTASLLAVARDDDFTHGVLQSRFFSTWWHRWKGELAPPVIVESFPFPWAPVTLLSALTRVQEEHRLSIARAARAGEQEQLDAAVSAAYGEPNEMSDQDIVLYLEKLNRKRAAG